MAFAPKMRGPVAAILAVALAGLPVAARADDAPAPVAAPMLAPPAPVHGERAEPGERYVGTMITASSLGLTAMMLGFLSSINDDSRTALYITTAAHMATGAVVHGWRGRSAGRAGISLAARVALPLAGLYLVRCGCDADDSLALYGFLGGIGGSVALDIVLSSFRGRPASSSLSPAVSAQPGGMTVGLTGSF